MEDVRVPELGENIETAEVVSILVEVGQAIKKDQGIIEVESDKASLEIPSSMDGVVSALKVEVGQKIRAGQVIITVDTDKKSAPNESKKEESREQKIPEKESTAEIKQPQVNLPSPDTKVPDEDQTHFAYIKGGEFVSLGAASKPVINEPLPAAPSVRRFAREIGVDLNKVTGSGPRQRLLISDVKKYVKNLVQRRDSKAVSMIGGGVPELPDFASFGPIRHEKMSGIRRTIAERMSFSSTHIPHVTQFDEANISGVESFRHSKDREAKKRGVKLTVTVMLLKILALALRRFPIFNSSLDLAHDEILYKEYINIGVAVDTSKGLLVPVIRDADKKNVWQLAHELNDLATRSRDRKIKPDELQGGNISLTNLGGLGTTHFTPIINWPDVAVLGVGRAKERAVRKDTEWVSAMIMPLSISYDHRIIDGADAARFLRWICEGLENPLGILLDIGV